MDYVEKIKSIRAKIIKSFDDGKCPLKNEIVSGEEGKFLDAMESLGQVVMEGDRIVDLIGYNGSLGAFD